MVITVIASDRVFANGVDHCLLEELLHLAPAQLSLLFPEEANVLSHRCPSRNSLLRMIRDRNSNIRFVVQEI